MDSKNTLIFNNTFYDMNNSAVVDWTKTELSFFNNVIINTAKVLPYAHQIRMYSTNFKVYQNNLFFSSSVEPKIWVEPSSYTISQFNDLTIADNNLQFSGELNRLINIDNFTLPEFSPAQAGGRNIEGLIPEGFTDIKGNLVNQLAPSIGAVESSSAIDLNLKIFLQSLYNENKMETRLSSYLPLAQPYNQSPWNYNGLEAVQAIPPDVVDWMLVELRKDTSSSTTSAKRAAFLRSDGAIVDLDGKSPISFKVLSRDYYIIVMHRNHLGIMSADKVYLTENTSYDFTASPSSAYGDELADLGNGKYGMYAGDGDGNGVINFLDYEAVGNNIFRNGYQIGDIDLNGMINVLDYGKTNLNFLRNTKIPGPGVH